MKRIVITTDREFVNKALGNFSVVLSIKTPTRKAEITLIDRDRLAKLLEGKESLEEITVVSDKETSPHAGDTIVFLSPRDEKEKSKIVQIDLTETRIE
jgi:hypothetical protein